MGKVQRHCRSGKRGVSSWGILKATFQRPAGSTLSQHLLRLLCPTGDSPEPAPIHFPPSPPSLHAFNSLNTLIPWGHWLISIRFRLPQLQYSFSFVPDKLLHIPQNSAPLSLLSDASSRNSSLPFLANGDCPLCWVPTAPQPRPHHSFKTSEGVPK